MFDVDLLQSPPLSFKNLTVAIWLVVEELVVECDGVQVVND